MKNKLDYYLIHTGQHYNKNLSQVFFDELELPVPDINLEVGSGSHATQTAGIMKKIEGPLIKEKPDFVIVQGDTNSTLAAALVASKLNYMICHVEAGARLFDFRFPEEKNRIIIDNISDILIPKDENDAINLLNMGIPYFRIPLIGNTLVDVCLEYSKVAEYKSDIIEKLGIDYDYGLVTIHRDMTVDTPRIFSKILDAMLEEKDTKFIYPAHYRAMNMMKKLNFLSKLKSSNVKVIEPISYLNILKLLNSSSFVMTDSGGILCESHILSKPCLILRTTTEWTDVLRSGSAKLVGTNKEDIKKGIESLHDKKIYKRMSNARCVIKGRNTSKQIISFLEKTYKKSKPINSISIKDKSIPTYKLLFGSKLNGKRIKDLKDKWIFAIFKNGMAQLTKKNEIIEKNDIVHCLDYSGEDDE
jgi:UDP-N-acetylglucosamine 2-epimerase (non-hydrolysing)